MPNYFVSGRTADGREVTERIHADTPDQAVQQMKDRGLDNIVLHTDDVAAVLENPLPDLLTPREFVSLPKRGTVSRALFWIRKLYASSWQYDLFFVVLVAFRRLTG